MLYWTLMVLPLVYYLTSRKARGLQPEEEYTYSNKFYIIFGLIFILLVGLRADSIGLDTKVYIDNYKNIARLSDFKHLLSQVEQEHGYQILQRLVSKTNANYHIFFVICAVISIAPVFILIKKYSKDAWLSIFLYVGFTFYTFTMSTVRQSLAIGLCCLATLFIPKKKLFWYLLFALLATTFHKTAIIFLPMYWVYKLKPDKKTVTLFICIGILAYIFREQIMEFFNDNARIQYDNRDTGGKMQFLFLILNIILGMIYLDNIKKDELLRFAFYGICLTTILIPVISINPTLFRLYYYFYIFIIIYAPNLIHSIKDSLIRGLLTGGYMFVAVYFFYKFVISADIMIYPYKFFWQ